MAPEFKTTVTIKQAGEPIKMTLKCDNPTVTKDALYCVERKEAEEKGDCKAEHLYEYTLTSTGFTEEKTTKVCADVVISHDYKSVLYLRKNETAVQIYKVEHNGTEATLGSEIDLKDVTLDNAFIVNHFESEKFILMSKIGKLVVLNYDAPLAKESDVHQFSMNGNKVVIVQENSEKAGEYLYVELEPTNAYFKTTDELPKATEKYYEAPVLSTFLDVVMKMHEAKMLTLAPNATYAVSENDREVSATISAKDGITTTTTVDKKLKTVTTVEDKENTVVNFVGVKTVAGETPGFELAQAELDFAAFKETTAKKLALTSTGTVCFLRIEEEVGEGEEKKTEVSYQFCGATEPDPKPAPGKLSGGAIAGIVIACVVVVAAAAVLLYFFVFKKK